MPPPSPPLPRRAPLPAEAVVLDVLLGVTTRFVEFVDIIRLETSVSQTTFLKIFGAVLNKARGASLLCELDTLFWLSVFFEG